MRNDLDTNRFRELLFARREALRGYASVRNEAAETVELDQQRTGRLTRMDALQAQAMAQASQARAERELRRIDAAIARLERGDFGYCLRCNEDIAAARLEVDPSTGLCIDCAEAADRA